MVGKCQISGFPILLAQKQGKSCCKGVTSEKQQSLWMHLAALRGWLALQESHIISTAIRNLNLNGSLLPNGKHWSLFTTNIWIKWGRFMKPLLPVATNHIPALTSKSRTWNKSYAVISGLELGLFFDIFFYKSPPISYKWMWKKNNLCIAKEMAAAQTDNPVCRKRHFPLHRLWVNKKTCSSTSGREERI